MSEPPPAPVASAEQTRSVSPWRLFVTDWVEAAGRPLLALVFVWLLGLVPALLIWAWGGPGGAVRTPLLAWYYVSAFHAVPFSASASGGLAEALGFTPIGVALFVCPMLGTAAALTLCFHAGRGLARRSAPRVQGRATWIVLASASRIAIVYALAFCGISAIAKLTFSYGGAFSSSTITVHPELVAAFVGPLVLALAAALAGAYSAVRDRAGAPMRLGAALVTGGAAAFVVAVVIGIAGWAVVALVNPDGTASYARWLHARGAAGATTLLANQALALPNHGMLVLAPAMGSCDQLKLTGAEHDLLCLRHIPADPGSILSASNNFQPGQIPQRPAPQWFLAFLLIPAAACSVGGVAAAREASRSGRPGIGYAALAGVGSGVLFAVLAGVGAFLVAVRVDVNTGGNAFRLALGPDPYRTALLGLGWGLVFCTAGALVWAIRHRPLTPRGTPEPERPDAAVPGVS